MGKGRKEERKKGVGTKAEGSRRVIEDNRRERGQREEEERQESRRDSKQRTEEQLVKSLTERKRLFLALQEGSVANKQTKS